MDISDLYDQVREMYALLPIGGTDIQYDGQSYQIYNRLWSTLIITSSGYTQYRNSQISIRNYNDDSGSQIVPVRVIAMPIEHCTIVKQHIDLLLQIYQVLLYYATAVVMR